METLAPKPENEEGFIRWEKFADEIYRSALEEHPKFSEFPEQEIKTTIKAALIEIETLEKAADPKEALTALTPEIAKNLKALWVFSGPGTYDSPVKDDVYKKYPWAAGMDHARLSYAAFLSRKISEKLSPLVVPERDIDKARNQRTVARKMIAESGPTIIYNGRADENEVVRNVLEREGIVIPKEKVLVFGQGINKTVDQIKDFSLPAELASGKEIGLISHAPHLMRIAHMLRCYRPLPKDMAVRMFPIATPTEGREEYTLLEIKGLLYYLYLSENKDAAKEPYPYIIHGEEKN